MCNLTAGYTQIVELIVSAVGGRRQGKINRITLRREDRIKKSEWVGGDWQLLREIDRS